MNNSPYFNHIASVVVQPKKDYVPGLGRGPGPKIKLQSRKSLKILQVNINGITNQSSRVKLNQTLGLDEFHKVQIIASKETKLKINTSLKIPGYDIDCTLTEQKRMRAFIPHQISYLP